MAFAIADWQSWPVAGPVIETGTFGSLISFVQEDEDISECQRGLSGDCLLLIQDLTAVYDGLYRGQKLAQYFLDFLCSLRKPCLRFFLDSRIVEG